MMQCNCAEGTCALSTENADEVTGYIAPCGQTHYCRDNGDVPPDCKSPYCTAHNEEGSPFDADFWAYRVRVERAKRDRGEPYDHKVVEVGGFRSKRLERVDELTSNLRFELRNKLDTLPAGVMERLELQEEMLADLLKEKNVYLNLIHRNCPDNKSKHRRNWSWLFHCIACYVDEQGAEHHCPLEVEAAELAADDYVLVRRLEL